MAREGKQGRYYGFAGITVLLWSTAAPSVKVLTEGLDSLCVLGWSSLFAAGFLLLLLAARGRAGVLRRYGPRDWGRLALLGFTGMFLYSALYYFGIGRLSAQEACILNYLRPAMIVLFSCLLLGEPLTGRKAAALGISFAGVLLAAAWELREGGLSGDVAGAAACVLAAACYGLFSVLNKKLAPDQNAAMAVYWGVTALCALAAAGLRGGLALPSPLQGAGLVWLGIAVHGVPYFLWALALNGVGNTARVANLAYLTPVLTVLLSAAALGESLPPVYLAALACVLAGILVQNGRMRKKG